jgi:hypothetical protein
MSQEKRRAGTKKQDRHEGFHQISDQSIQKRLKKMHLKQYGTDLLSDQPTDQLTDG